MAGVRLWEFYIRLPQDIVDDPDIDLSLNAFRLITYLCRHQLRLGKTQIRMTQDEIIHGRKDHGVRVDHGSKITSQRDVIKAREELIDLGWLKYYALEGAWIYELVIQDQPVQGQLQNATDVGSKMQPPTGAKCNRNRLQNATGIRDKVLHKNTSNTKAESHSSAAPSNATGFHSTLEALKQSEAQQPDLLRDRQPDLLAVPSAEHFNSIEVAHAMTVELALAGNANKIMLDESLRNYRAKHQARTWQQCGEDLLALWHEYDSTVKGKFKRGFKSFFSDGVFLRRSEWTEDKPVSKPAQDARAMLDERRKRIGSKVNG